MTLAENSWIVYLDCCFSFTFDFFFGVEKVGPLQHQLLKGEASKILSGPSGKCRTLGNPFVIVEKVFRLVNQKSRFA